jgi:hypothetical protein
VVIATTELLVARFAKDAEESVTRNEGKTPMKKPNKKLVLGLRHAPVLTKDTERCICGYPTADTDIHTEEDIDEATHEQETAEETE